MALAFEFELDGAVHTVTILARRPRLTLAIDGIACVVSEQLADDGAVMLDVDGQLHRVARIAEAGRLHLHLDGRTHAVAHADAISAAQRDAGGDDCLRAEMPGVVVAVNHAAEAEVVAGDVLLVIESMKMQLNVVAHRAGRVAELHVTVNQSFDKGAALVTLHPDES